MRAEAEVGVTQRIAKDCQALPASTGSWEKDMEQILPQNPSERAQPCRHPESHFRPPEPWGNTSLCRLHGSP